MSNIKYARPRFWKRAVRFALDVLSAILILCAVLCTFVSSFLLNAQTYKDVIITEEFDSAVIASIKESINASSSVVELPENVILEAVGEDRIIAYSHDYTLEYIDSIITNKTFEPKEFKCQGLKEAIFKQMEEYSEVTVVTEEEATAVYEYTLENIQKTLQYIPKIVLDASPSAAKVLSALSIVPKLEIPFYAIALLVIVCAFWFGGKQHFNDVFFGVSAATWIAVCTVEIPILMITVYNIPARLALSKTTFYYLVKGVFDMLFARSALVFGIAFAVATVAVIIAVILKVKNRKKQLNEEKPEKFYRVHFEKEQ